MPLISAASSLYAHLLGDQETARCLDDRAEVEAMLAVEAALAEAQVLMPKSTKVLGPDREVADVGQRLLTVKEDRELAAVVRRGRPGASLGQGGPGRERVRAGFR